MQALILAGGRGMRLDPLTNDVPSALLHLPAGTLLDYAVHHLVQLKYDRAMVMLQYRGDQIARRLAEHYSNRWASIPQSSPFTLHGALVSAIPHVEGPTLVLHCNQYLGRALDYLVERAHPRRAAFLATEEELVRGRPGELGAYILPPEAFHAAARRPMLDDVGALFDTLKDEGIERELVPVRGWARSLQTPTDLLMVNRFLLKNYHDCFHPWEIRGQYDALNYNWIASGARVEDSNRLFFATIGPRARISRSRLYNTLVLAGVEASGLHEQHVVLAPASNGLLRLYTPQRDLELP